MFKNILNLCFFLLFTVLVFCKASLFHRSYDEEDRKGRITTYSQGIEIQKIFLRPDPVHKNRIQGRVLLTHKLFTPKQLTIRFYSMYSLQGGNRTYLNIEDLQVIHLEGKGRKSLNFSSVKRNKGKYQFEFLVEVPGSISFHTGKNKPLVFESPPMPKIILDPWTGEVVPFKKKSQPQFQGQTQPLFEWQMNLGNGISSDL